MQLLVSIIDSEKRSSEVSKGASTLAAERHKLRVPAPKANGTIYIPIFHPSGCSSHACACGSRGKGAELCSLSKSAIKPGFLGVGYSQ